MTEPVSIVERRKSRSPGFRHDEIDLIRNDKGIPVWNMANAIALLTDHDDWQGVLAYDEFNVQRVCLRPIPGQLGGAHPRPVDDDDYTAVQACSMPMGLLGPDRAGSKGCSRGVHPARNRHG